MKIKELGCVAQGHHSLVEGGHGRLGGDCSVRRGPQGGNSGVLQQGTVPPVDRTASMRGLVVTSSDSQFLVFPVLLNITSHGKRYIIIEDKTYFFK